MAEQHAEVVIARLTRVIISMRGCEFGGLLDQLLVEIELSLLRRGFQFTLTKLSAGSNMIPNVTVVLIPGS